MRARARFALEGDISLDSTMTVVASPCAFRRLLKKHPRACHDAEVVMSFTDIMGHAGGIVRHPSGVLESAADRRGDGVVAAF
jgi:hypothetical protein